MNPPESENVARAVPAARWQRLADRLAQYGWPILLVSIAVGLIRGVILAANGSLTRASEECRARVCGLFP